MINYGDRPVPGSSCEQKLEVIRLHRMNVKVGLPRHRIGF